MASKLKISDASTETPTLVRWANEVVNDLNNVVAGNIGSTASLQAQVSAIAPVTQDNNENNIVPQDVTGVSVTQSLQILNGVTYTQLTVTYTSPLVGTPVQDVSAFPTEFVVVDVFGGIFLGIRGYQGSSQIVKIAEDNYAGGPGGTHTFTVNLFPTQESVDLFFIAKSFSGVSVDDWTTEPSVTVTLDGSTQAYGIVAGTLSFVPNNLFTASVAPPFPGWVTDAGVAISMDAASGTFPTSGCYWLAPGGSCLIPCPQFTVTSGHTGIYSSTRWKAYGGDTFKATVQAKRVSGTGAEMSLRYFDVQKNLLFTDTATYTSTTWGQIQLTSAAPAGSVYVELHLGCIAAADVCEVTSPGLLITADSFAVTPINTNATFLGGNPLSATTGGSANHATVSIAANTVQFGNGQVSYNSGSITPLNDGTAYFIFADDPAFKGGAVTYQASTTFATVFGFNGRMYFGAITTPAFGGGGTSGTGGGGGGGGGGGRGCPPTCF